MKSINLKKFAEVLVRVGREQNLFDSLMADLTDVAQKIDANLELKRYLTDQHLSLAEKKAALRAVFEDFISERTYNFVLLLIKNEKLTYFDEIIAEAQKHYWRVDDIHEVIVESVVALEASTEKALKEVLVSKLKNEILLRNKINPELLGGLRIIIGDRVIDSSLSGKLKRLHDKINKIE